MRWFLWAAEGKNITRFSKKNHWGFETEVSMTILSYAEDQNEKLVKITELLKLWDIVVWWRNSLGGFIKLSEKSGFPDMHHVTWSIGSHLIPRYPGNRDYFDSWSDRSRWIYENFFLYKNLLIKGHMLVFSKQNKV